MPISVSLETEIVAVTASLRYKLRLLTAWPIPDVGRHRSILGGSRYSYVKVSSRGNRLTGSLRRSYGRPGGFPGRSRFSKPQSLG